MFLVTTLPAPIIQFLPIFIPGKITDPAPIRVPSPISTAPHNVLFGAMWQYSPIIQS